MARSAARAEMVAARQRYFGARNVAAEHCAELRGRMPALPPRCIAALPAGAAPGAVRRTRVLPGGRTKIVKHLHSGPTSPDGYHVPVTPPPSTTQVEHPAAGPLHHGPPPTTSSRGG